jgi:hypothetical protein
VPAAPSPAEGPARAAVGRGTPHHGHPETARPGHRVTSRCPSAAQVEAARRQPNYGMKLTGRGRRFATATRQPDGARDGLPT